MKNYINYYYNLYPDVIDKKGKYYIFIFNNEKYYFIPYERSLKELDTLIKLNKEMINRGSLVHEIIATLYDKVLVNVDNNNYILMRIYVDDNKIITLNDIIYMNNLNSNVKSNEFIGRTNWSTLWENKVDYLEYQIGHLISKYKLTYKIIDYYIGLSENAIAYFNNNYMKFKNSMLTISHKRILCNSTLFDLYNPINLIIDYSIRDIAEYIKSCFFSGKDVTGIINLLLNNCNFMVNDIEIFYSRMLFPSYFFDIYEDVLNNNKGENVLDGIIKKSSSYEEVLGMINDKIINNKIEWL